MNSSLMTNNYITSFPISSYRVDCRKKLKPYAFMASAQDVANINASALGCGYSQLLEKNITWVLSRMKTEFVKAPEFLQNTVMETWQKGMQGPFSIRDFEVRDAAASDVLVRCTSSWLLIDLNTRRLVRMDRLIGDLLQNTAVHKDAIPKACGKIRISVPTSLTSSREVKFSDIDYNFHVNNAKYMEWAIDSLGPELPSSHDIASYEISFNHEAHISDTVEFHTGELSELSRYVEGRRGEDIIFQSIINFKA